MMTVCHGGPFTRWWCSVRNRRSRLPLAFAPHSPGRRSSCGSDADRCLFVGSTRRSVRFASAIVHGGSGASCLRSPSLGAFSEATTLALPSSAQAGNRVDDRTRARTRTESERARCRAVSSSVSATSTASVVRSGAGRSAISTSVRSDGRRGEIPIRPWAPRAECLCHWGENRSTCLSRAPRDPSPIAAELTETFTFSLTGTHIQTGEEVGIKLVRRRDARPAAALLRKETLSLALCSSPFFALASFASSSPRERFLTPRISPFLSRSRLRRNR